MNGLAVHGITGLICIWLIVGCSPPAGGRSAKNILRELEAVKVPSLTMSERSRLNQQELAQFAAKVQAAEQKRAELIRELFLADPDHKDIPFLMLERWGILSSSGDFDEAIAETDEIIFRAKSDESKNNARSMKGLFYIRQKRGGEPAALSAIESYIQHAPEWG